VKRILHLIPGLEGGGAEFLLYKLIEFSSSRNYEHTVVSMTNDGVFGNRIRALGAPVITLGMKRGRPGLGGMARFWSTVSLSKPGLIHAWMYHANLLGAISAPPRGIPLIWALHATELEESQYSVSARLTRKLCIQLSGVPDVVVANSMTTYAHHIESGYRARRWEIIPNGFDTSRFLPQSAARERIILELGLRPDAFLIGLFARLDPMKDHQTFLDAASIFARDVPSAHFILAGSDITWQNAHLREMIVQRGLDHRVSLLGYREDIESVTAALDVATSSSVFGESFSNTTAEAMACGVPCVVTALSAVVELVGSTGIVVSLRAPTELARAWKDLLEAGAEGRRTLGERGVHRIRELFTIQYMVERYEALYRSLTAQHSRNESEPA